MDQFYIFIVVVLFLLAISDLVVGVSNDAVNFLNSAIGSKAAPFRAIMIVAAAGILVGATFSSGMMEVARKGIMHPGEFYFSEIMLIFLAVMLTDIILLDLYNTFGLPTSTTVSIVFELLGASVAMAIIKMNKMGQPLSEMGQYINSEKAMAIIFGILVSVVIAFAVGALVGFISRVVFSFNYEKTYKRYGGLFGGVAIAAITYFMLIKGAKGSSLITEAAANWISTHTWTIIGISFVGWTILLQALIFLTRINVFKLIVMVGTFSLAMAFAGNDLVNFIGVPLAGFEALKDFLNSPETDPGNMLMSSLSGAVKTPTLFLLLAGLVMVITLWFSKKARSVTRTTINLSRQGEGYERFNSTGLARMIVRHSVLTGNLLNKIVPSRVISSIEKRFEPAPAISQEKGVSFDLVRASVNLVVAAILIGIGTSLKLPLSTTYVTFMVAMGTSLADRAWGRESAVYRITGVVTVITGWFVTAFLAFTASFIIANILSAGGFIAIIIIILFALALLLRSHLVHRRREKEELARDETVSFPARVNFHITFSESIASTLQNFSEIFEDILDGLAAEKRKKLKNQLQKVKVLKAEIKDLKEAIPKNVAFMKDEEVDAGHNYVQIIDYLRETVNALQFIAKPGFDHVDNNHRGLIPDQKEELKKIRKAMNTLITELKELIAVDDFTRMEKIQTDRSVLLEILAKGQKNQLKRIKNEEAGTRNSLLYIGLLQETKNITLYLGSLAKSYKDFKQHK